MAFPLLRMVLTIEPISRVALAASFAGNLIRLNPHIPREQEDKSNFVRGTTLSYVLAKSVNMRPSQAIYLDKAEELLPMQNDAEIVVTIPESSRRRRRWRRICALGLHTCICLLMFSSYIRDNVKSFFMPPFVMSNEVVSISGWSIPPDISLGGCAQWTEEFVPSGGVSSDHPLITAAATFELPISSNTLLFLSRGAISGGLNVQYGGYGNDVRVTVKASYRFPEALDTVDVCIVTRSEGEIGLGIFSSPRSHPSHRRAVLQFAVTVNLPRVEEGSLLNVKAFETDMPLFIHEIGDLNGFVHFDSISLKTSNLPIRVKSLEAEKASIVTTNSPIEGEFHSSSSLKLYTSNSPVDVHVTLFNADGGNYTNLDISTSNSAIKGTLALESANESRGKFKIFARTSVSPLQLSFVEAPVDSVLLLDATTSLGPAAVSLDSTYEGSYTAVTSLQRPSILFNPDVEDPAGKGRKRQMRSSPSRGPIASGTVRWSDGDDHKKLLGNVNVRTSLAPLTLKI
ncbi:hypothetical protein E4T56_gene13462 [Termitomyces sp. T112]|nr:hypothetical protein E4T56_gene13462 [Termitomyces sp. T112]